MGGDGSGGRRDGAGRPRQTRKFAEDHVKAVKKALKLKQVETGRDLWTELVDMAYDKDIMDTARLGAVKILVDVVCPKKVDMKVEQVKGPTIYLPEIMEEPKGDDESDCSTQS